MNLNLGLDQFWRIAELRHVAAAEGAMATIHLRVGDEPDSIVATATDSFCLAQWQIESDFGGGFDLDGPVLLVADAAGEALAALKGMVKIDRGKWDPVGWRVTVSGEGDSVSVAAFDPFGERRGDIMVPTFSGHYPKYEALFGSKAEGRAQMGVNPKRLLALAKTTTSPEQALFLSFRGDKAALVTASSDEWRGLIVPILNGKDGGE